MRRERVWLSDVGVIFLLRDAIEGHDFRFRPILEISRSGTGDGTKTGVAFARPNAEVEHIAVFCSGPEGDILGIKDTGGEDSFVLKFGPVDPIGGDETEEPMFVISRNGFESLAGVNVGINVEKRGEIVGDLHLGIILDQNDIGVIAIFKWEETELGLYPIFPIAALSVAGVGIGLDGTMSAVIHAEQIPIADYDDVEAVGAFPRLIEGESGGGGGGIDEFVGNPGQLIDQITIKEGLAPRADRQHCIARILRGSRHWVEDCPWVGPANPKARHVVHGAFIRKCSLFAKGTVRVMHGKTSFYRTRSVR